MTVIINNLQNKVVRETSTVIMISTVKWENRNFKELHDLPNSWAASKHQNKDSKQGSCI